MSPSWMFLCGTLHLVLLIKEYRYSFFHLIEKKPPTPHIGTELPTIFWLCRDLPFQVSCNIVYPISTNGVSRLRDARIKDGDRGYNHRSQFRPFILDRPSSEIPHVDPLTDSPDSPARDLKTIPYIPRSRLATGHPDMIARGAF